MFGLLLFIFGFGSIVYLTKSTNELIFQLHPQIAAIEQMANPSKVDLVKKEDMEKQISIAGQDKTGLCFYCYIIILIGFFLMLFGFGKWHWSVQPIQDKITKLQLEKLRLEVKELANRLTRSD